MKALTNLKLASPLSVLLVGLVLYARLPGDNGPNPNSARAPVTTLTGPTYHGGPVLGVSTPLTIYYVWYGNWTINSLEVSVLDTFARYIGGSPYLQINTSYHDATHAPITGAVNFGGQTFDNYSQGTSVSDEFTIVSAAIQAGKLPVDENGVYIVLTSADVSVYGFCTSICGRHRSGVINGANIKYAFVGDSSLQCAGFCSRWAVGPNGPGGVDAMASIIAHELDETLTNPNGNAWYNGAGDENADLCTFQYGKIFHTASHAPANMTLGGLDFIIQANWRNTTNPGCALSLNGR